ncbi:MAG: hypothetical protein ACH34X_10670 [Thiolinea sp.]
MKYDDGKQNQLFREQFGCERLLLHAQALSLLHPATQQALVISSALPIEFGAILKQVCKLVL